MEHFRVAYAANLNRSADTLERLAAKLADGYTRLDSLDESQAYIDAGAAIWGATLRGFLAVQEIIDRVQELALVGFSEPDTVTDNGMHSSNLFFGAMSDYVLPLGESVAPYESLGNSKRWPPSNDDRMLFRRNELRCQATGCRILARLIGETGGAEAAASSPKTETSDDGEPWSKPDGLSQWAKKFGFSPDTLKRRFKDGTIRHKKLSIKSYRIHVDDLPK